MPFWLEFFQCMNDSTSGKQMIVPYLRHAMDLGFLLLQCFITTPSITAVPGTVELQNGIECSMGEPTGRALGRGLRWRGLVGWTEVSLTHSHMRTMCVIRNLVFKHELIWELLRVGGYHRQEEWGHIVFYSFHRSWPVSVNSAMYIWRLTLESSFKILRKLWHL